MGKIDVLGMYRDRIEQIDQDIKKMRRSKNKANKGYQVKELLLEKERLRQILMNDTL